MTPENKSGDVHATPDDVYVRFVRRVTPLIALFGCAGALIVGFRWGVKTGVGFLLGAALSYLSFWRWRRVADAMGTAPARRASIVMILRFALLIAVAYGIIKYLELPAGAVLSGLLSAGAAVTVALLLELF